MSKNLDTKAALNSLLSGKIFISTGNGVLENRNFNSTIEKLNKPLEGTGLKIIHEFQNGTNAFALQGTEQTKPTTEETKDLLLFVIALIDLYQDSSDGFSDKELLDVLTEQCEEQYINDTEPQRHARDLIRKHRDYLKYNLNLISFNDNDKSNVLYTFKPGFNVALTAWIKTLSFEKPSEKKREKPKEALRQALIKPAVTDSMILDNNAIHDLCDLWNRKDMKPYRNSRYLITYKSKYAAILNGPTILDKDFEIDPHKVNISEDKIALFLGLDDYITNKIKQDWSTDFITRYKKDIDKNKIIEFARDYGYLKANGNPSQLIKRIDVEKLRKEFEKENKK